MTYLYKNFAESMLAEELLASDTVLKILPEDSAVFPTLVEGAEFLLTLFDGVNAPEIVRVTAASGTTLTVERAQEGTSSTQWSVGALVRLAPTASQCQEFWDALGGNGLVVVSSANAGIAFNDWNRRRGAAHITAGASNYNLALPTTATLYDEILLSIIDAGVGVVTLKQGATSIWTLEGTTDWVLLRWSGTAWLGVAGTSVGPQGTAGNTILSGTAAPTTEGVDGDFYIEDPTTAPKLYGPKTAGAWGTGTALVNNGNTVLNGTTVPTTEGVDGDFYIKDPTTAPVMYGPKTAGSWGSGIALVGPSGPGSGDMLKTDNLSGLASAAASRSNLGLGTAAVANIGTGAGTVAAGDDSRFSGLSVTNFSADATLALTDAGKLLRHTSAIGHALTIPPNSSVAFSIGTVIPVRVFGLGAVLLTRGSGVTLTSAGSGTNTDISLAQYDYRVLVKEDTNTWVLL